MKSGEVLKNLMLGLIYPAVLGSIIYLAMAEVTDQATALWTVFSTGQSYDPSLNVSLKFVLLGVTLVFYGCDYLYLLFTNNFNLGFFILDIIFIATLYVTVLCIGINDGEKTPQILGIIACYAVFMILYLGWDIFEKRRCTAAEKSFYRSVIVWELWSLGGLAVLGATKLTFGDRWRNLATGKAVELLVVVTALAVVTYFFARHTWRKRLFLIATSSETKATEEAESEYSVPPNPGPQPDVTAGAVPHG